MTDKIITAKEVEYVAKLANLSISEKEKDQYTEQLNSILEYFKKINKLDTRHVKPTAYILDMPNLLNDDKVGKSLPQKEVSTLSDESKDGYFKVPKMM